jgi:hypothetical protein
MKSRHNNTNHINRKGSYSIMKKNRENKNEPTIAPGLDDQNELEQNATKNEIKKGESTSVYTLSYDEVDPSE